MATQQDPSSTGEPMFHIPESACEHLLMIRDQLRLLATLVQPGTRWRRASRSSQVNSTTYWKQRSRALLRLKRTRVRFAYPGYAGWNHLA